MTPSDDMSPTSTSPLHFHHHSKHSATHAADISRILDPSYSSSSASSSNVHAYVDRNGDLHDPDYRHFPIAHQPNSTKRNSTHSSYGYNLPTRPTWELIDEDALDIDDDEYDLGEYPTNGRTKNNNIKRPSSFSSYQYSSPTYSYHPQYQYSSSPQSATLDSDDTVFDEYEEFEQEAFVEKEKEKEHRRSNGVSHIIKSTRTKFATPPTTIRSHSKERKRWSSTTIADDATTVTVLSTSAANDSTHTPTSPVAHVHAVPIPPTQYQEKEERERERSERRARDLEREVEGERWTPTCTQAIRREWQAVSLRIRFGVFRAQRRMKSRIASFT